MRSFTGLILAAALFGLAALASHAVAQVIASAEAPKSQIAANVARIKSGDVNCPHCDLKGADLSNECVKKGDLTGADFTDVTAHYMCMSYANFTDVSFKNADLTGANLGHADLTRADFTGAKLSITSIKGADLSTAKGLTQAQLDRACGDADTKLPAGLHASFCK
jgi:uncharacterized protein YjbI with pentapeptide repeats